jgi:hypothetical protein
MKKEREKLKEQRQEKEEEMWYESLGKWDGKMVVCVSSFELSWVEQDKVGKEKDKVHLHISCHNYLSHKRLE